MQRIAIWGQLDSIVLKRGIFDAQNFIVSYTHTPTPTPPATQNAGNSFIRSENETKIDNPKCHPSRRTPKCNFQKIIRAITVECSRIFRLSNYFIVLQTAQAIARALFMAVCLHVANECGMIFFVEGTISVAVGCLCVSVHRTWLSAWPGDEHVKWQLILECSCWTIRFDGNYNNGTDADHHNNFQTQTSWIILWKT